VPAPQRRGGALLVAAGILLSRLAGLVRQRALAHFLGAGDEADALNASFRIPNFLQNLLGEGVLSASFIPVYAQLRARKDHTPEENERDASRVASAAAGLLGLVVSILCVLGILLAPLLIDLIAPGFTGEKQHLTIKLVQIVFPGISLMVLSAFCIGVFNSHHRFFIGYAAPVLWSAAQIAALLFGARQPGQTTPQLALWAAWGSVAGAALQLAVQAPLVLGLLGGLRRGGFWPTLGRGNPHAAEVVRNFFPVLAGRGVVQLSAYLDGIISSWLPTGAVAALGYAQTLYLLPVSLFGMSVSAAALPSMAAAQGEAGPEAREALRAQLAAGLRNIAYPVVPSVVVLWALGDVACAALFRTGKFGDSAVLYVAMILAGSTLGLLAATQARLYSSAFYALKDTRTPLRYAAVRVVLTGALGVLGGLWLPKALGVDPELGAPLLTATAGLAGWLEFLLLKRGLEARVGEASLPAGLLLRLWSAAALAGAAGVLVRETCERLDWLAWPVLRAGAVFGAFGVVYLAATLALGVPEARGVIRRLRRQRG
jgi:putative peptidoglycan lipid II flippase